MEWEDLNEKYAGIEISKRIHNESEAVIVLLGRNLENPPSPTPNYTHNWVNFEVGVAAGCHKPVWVLEDYEQSIKFPIPYVTDYVQYKVGNPEHLRVIGEIFAAQFVRQSQSIAPTPIKCHHCHAEYNYWWHSDDWSKSTTLMNCPVCRRTVERK